MTHNNYFFSQEAFSIPLRSFLSVTFSMAFNFSFGHLQLLVSYVFGQYVSQPNGVNLSRTNKAPLPWQLWVLAKQQQDILSVRPDDSMLPFDTYLLTSVITL